MEHGTHESLLRGCRCVACIESRVPDVLQVGDRIRFTYDRRLEQVASIVKIFPVSPVSSSQLLLSFSDGSRRWFSYARLKCLSWEVVDDVPSRPPKYSRDEIVGMFT